MCAAKLLDDFEKCTRDFKLCPNRVWAVAGKKLPVLMPPQIKRETSSEDEDHGMCTYDLCEYSQRDFTAVQQRHECKNRDTCIQLQGLFSRKALAKALMDGRSTAWRLDGKAILEEPLPYMAISHVWADGTGIGAWQDGQVNDCLYDFFRAIAKQFQCEGIWWDTLCVPRDKAVHTIALRNIHRRYEDARVTLVHDRFLRNWEWDPNTACFAILMSPWFSRGWTALELARSRKVYVVFKGPSGLCMKDLDQEILAKPDEVGPRREASEIIRKFRAKIGDLNGLLTALGPRHTSWPKDRAIISGLLADVEEEITTSSQKDVWQQDVYKHILRKMGNVSPAHLFHNSATMADVCWCSTTLFDMPMTSLDTTLQVTQDLDLIGTWQVLPAKDILDKCAWDSTHPMIEERLRLHLEDEDRLSKCVLLTDCYTKLGEQPRAGRVVRALLVEARAREATPSILRGYRYVGAIRFLQDLAKEDFGQDCPVMTIVLLGNIRGTRVLEGNAWDLADKSTTEPERQGEHIGQDAANAASSKPAYPTSSGSTLPLHDATWRGNLDKFLSHLNEISLLAEDQLGQQPLHLAAERGNQEMVLTLLDKARMFGTLEDVMKASCGLGQTPLHRAAWGGSAGTTEILLKAARKADFLDLVGFPDSHGNLALHIAAEKGFGPVVRQLLDAIPEHGHSPNNKGVTPLHFAAATGDMDSMKMLLDAVGGERDRVVKAEDKRGWSPLHYAAERGQEEVVRLLLDSGADVNATDKKLHWTPLHFAAMNGSKGVVKLLMERGGHPSLEDNHGWTPLRFAEVKKHSPVARLLEERTRIAPNLHDADATPQGSDGTRFDILDDKCWTSMHCVAMNEQQWAIRSILDCEEPLADAVLLHAIKQGYKKVVELLLEKGADMETRDKHGRTSLWWAIEHGHEILVQLLLAKGADMEAKDTIGRTPLHRAAQNGHEALVQLLLDQGANMEAKDWYGRTPLRCAVENDHASVVQLLLEHGVAIETVDSFGQTPLAWAAANGNEAIVELLLNNDADIDTQMNHRSYGWSTPMALAAEMGHISVVQLLLSRGARHDNSHWQRTIRSATGSGHEAIVRFLLQDSVRPESSPARDLPLPDAVHHGHTTLVKLLLDHGADVEGQNTETSNDPTPLWHAAVRGYKAIAEVLLDHGADVNGDAYSPLSEAAGRGHVTIVRLLLSRGANVEGGKYEEKAPLWAAASNGHDAVMQLLLDHNANVEAKGRQTWTPLQAAAAHGHGNAVRLLLGKGASTGQHEEEERGLLLRAILSGNEGVVQLLLDHVGGDVAKNGRGMDNEAVMRLVLEKGVDIEAENAFDQRRPLAWAANAGYEALVRMLLDKNAKIEAQDRQGYTPLHLAAGGGHQAVVQALLDKGAKVDAEDYDGRTPLWCAARNGCEAAAKILLDNNARVNGTYEKPLAIAAENGHKAMVQLLIDRGAAVSWKPLLDAAASGHVSVVRLLISRGANKTEDQRAELWENVRAYQRMDVVQLLIDNGAMQPKLRPGPPTRAKMTRTMITRLNAIDLQSW